MSLGQRLKKARESKKLLQKDVATKLGVSHNTISQYENNIRKPDPETLNTFADIYEVSTDWLLGRTDSLTENKGQLTSQEFVDFQDYLERAREFVKQGGVLEYQGMKFDLSSLDQLEHHIKGIFLGQKKGDA